MKTPDQYYEASTCYFSKPGSSSTERVLECVHKRARDLNIKDVLIASVTGSTALKAIEILGPDVCITVITHVTGFEKPNHQEMPVEVRERLRSMGVSVLTTQHAFGGVGRSIRKQLGTYQVDEIIAFTLRNIWTWN